MKNVFVAIAFLSLMFFAFVGVASSQDDEPQVMPGTEAAEFQQGGESGQCFVFNKYVVKTKDSEDGGSDVSVYKRAASAAAENACETGGEPWLYVADSDNNSFFGIAGKYLFIDSGRSVDSRGLIVSDLDLHKTIITQGYSGDPKLILGRFILFDEPSDKKGPITTCKEAAKWKRQGGGVGWVQGKKLDLETLKAINVGGLRCVYME